MIFRQLFDSVSCTYTYLLADEGSRQAMLIDPVFEHFERDAALLRELGLELAYTLDTHLHADHVTAAWLHKQRFGSQIVLSSKYGAQYVDRGIDHGDGIQLGDHSVGVRATPGHTHGCLTYVLESQNIAFTGDALLIRGAGRTDFQQGDAHTLYRSIREQIFTLPDSCMLYPAHDYQGRTVTTVREELDFNARIGGAADEGDFVGYMNNLGLAHPKKIDVAVPANSVCGKPEHEVEQESWGPVQLTYAGVPQIEAEWVATHREALHVLDVRNNDEVSTGKIADSIHIPLDRLREQIDQLPTDKPIVTVCRSGRRSAQAALILRKADMQTANVAGGMLRWRELALPTS